MGLNITFHCAALLVVFTAVPAGAQVQSRPTDPPIVTAANEAWYQLREPIQFAGDLYFRAGPAVFFDGNVMVRTGYYNGVPLYADTTVEPYSVVLVPVRSGLMQPYERLRRGDLAGTTGSRTPSFPVRAVPERPSLTQAPGEPTDLARPIGSIAASAFPAPVRPTPAAGAAVAVPTQGEAPQSTAMTSVARPEGNDGVWIRYKGTRWVSAGAAVPLRASEFRAVGQYEGFPVFARKDDEKTIYLPTRAGLVAPYRAR